MRIFLFCSFTIFLSHIYFINLSHSTDINHNKKVAVNHEEIRNLSTQIQLMKEQLSKIEQESKYTSESLTLKQNQLGKVIEKDQVSVIDHIKSIDGTIYLLALTVTIITCIFGIILPLTINFLEKKRKTYHEELEHIANTKITEVKNSSSALENDYRSRIEKLETYYGLFNDLTKNLLQINKDVSDNLSSRYDLVTNTLKNYADTTSISLKNEIAKIEERRIAIDQIRNDILASFNFEMEDDSNAEFSKELYKNLRKFYKISHALELLSCSEIVKQQDGLGRLMDTLNNSSFPFELFRLIDILKSQGKFSDSVLNYSLEQFYKRFSEEYTNYKKLN